MKKLLALLAVVLCVVSCQTEPEGLDVNVGGEIDAIVNVTIPEVETRAANSNSALGAFANVDFSKYTIRYILQVYYNNEPSQERLVKYSDDTSVAFDVRLVPGRDYNFVVWADIVEGNNYVDNQWSNADDLHYNTTNLHNITLKSTWVAMDETRDAFTATKLIEDYNGAMSIDMPLKRPFAKLRVVTTDLKNLTNLGIIPYKATVSYANAHRESFNALNGTYGAKTKENVNFTYNIAPYGDNTDKEMVLFTDYFFAPKRDLVNEPDLVKFTIDVMEDNGSHIGDIVAFNTDIPVNANYLTTIKGNILTDGKNFEVKIEDAFENANNLEDKPYYNEIVEVKNATDLQEAINNSTEETTIVFGGDINLGDLLAGILSTRAAAALPIVIPEGKVVALDLNGFNLTTPFVEGSNTNHTYAFENHGSLTIQDSKGNGQIIARGIFNYGTMTLKSGIINACDGNGGYGVRNYEGAEFIMNGGSIVTSYEDGDIPGNGYDASPVRVDEGATATINGGAINNISNFTVAIDNYGETTINDGTFTTIHTTIANSATMTINGGSFTCNGLEGVTAHAFWAAAGTTTINGGTFDGKDNYNGFNVCASAGAEVNIYGGKFLPVHSGSLYGEGTIIVKGGEFFDKIANKYVAFGYEVVEENSVYVVRKPQALIAFEEAIANGGNVTLTTDITLPEPVVIESGKTVVLNLNGKTITGSHHKSIGAIIKNNGNLTIVGGTISSTGENGGSAVQNNGTLTIEDATLNGAPNANGSWPSYTVNNTGTMTLENTTITSYHGAVSSYNNGAVATLNNCTIDMAGIPGFTNHGIYTYNAGKVIVNGGTYENKATDQNSTGASVINGAVEVNAGIFSGRIENYSGTPVLKGGTFSVKPNKNFVAAGYNVIEKDGKYVVVPEDVDVIASTPAEILSAIKVADQTVYVMPTADGSAHKLEGKLSMAEGVKLIGMGDTPVALFNDWGSNAFANQAHFTNTHIENINFTNNLIIDAGIANGDVKFVNCVFGGDLAHQGVHFDSGKGTITFENCTFIGRNMFGSSLKNVVFNNCTFLNKKSSLTGADKWTGVNMWGKYEFNNCTFDTEAHCNVKCDGVVAAFNNCKYVDNREIETVINNSQNFDAEITF